MQIAKVSDLLLFFLCTFPSLGRAEQDVDTISTTPNIKNPKSANYLITHAFAVNAADTEPHKVNCLSFLLPEWNGV